jgi:hypothetical protein
VNAWQGGSDSGKISTHCRESPKSPSWGLLGAACWERAVACTVVATRFQLSVSRKSAGDSIITRLRFGSKSGTPWQKAESIRLGGLTGLLFAVGSIERYICHLPF